MRWFKFYGQDWLTDTKILGMILEDRLIFITLLSIADENGVVKNGAQEHVILKLTQLPDDPYNDLNPFNNGGGYVERMCDNGMITLSDNGNDIIINNSLNMNYILVLSNLSAYRIDGR